MAVFELNADDTWLPQFARGKGLSTPKIRVTRKNGQRTEYTIPGNRQITVTDAREIRHLDIDPRFTRIS